MCPLSDVEGFYRDYLTNKKTTTEIGMGVVLQGGDNLNWYKLGESRGGAWRDSKPGAKNVYSNLAYGYIAALIELKTNQSFANFCKKHLFEPLGMTKTVWFRTDLPAGIKEAVPVEYRGGSKSWRDVGHYCFIDYASGELRTSARDLSKWGDALLQKGAPELWSSSTANKLFSCQEQNEQGNQASNCEFGLGWILLDNSMKGKASTDAWLGAFSQYD